VTDQDTVDFIAAAGEAEAVGFDDVGGDRAPVAHARLAGGIEQIQGDARLARGAVAGTQHHLRPAGHGQALGQIDIVQKSLGKELQDGSVQAVDVQAGLLVRAGDEAARGCAADHDRSGAGPDRGIVGGVLSGRPDRGRLKPGRDAQALADKAFSLALEIDLRGCAGGQKDNERHKSGQGANEHGARL